jgi:hypothetical protein
MFDINAIINNAIAQAVEAHITSLKQTYANQMGAMSNHISALDSDLSTERGNLQMALQRISDLEEANKVLVHRLNEETMRLALNHDKLVERVSEVRIRTDEARALSLALAESQRVETPAPTVLGDDDYFRRDALTSAFIEKLNSQEWFWDKVNAHIEGTIERLDESVDRHEVADIAKDTFDAEWQRKVGANDLLGRDEVADIVRELWAEEYEQEVQDKVERAIEDYDFEDTVRQAVRNYDFSDAVESVIYDFDMSTKITEAIDDYDLSDKITETLDDTFDIDDKVAEAMDGLDFDAKIRDVLRTARIDISI